MTGYGNEWHTIEEYIQADREATTWLLRHWTVHDHGRAQDDPEWADAERIRAINLILAERTAERSRNQEREDREKKEENVTRQ
jgi:hypothetical protein